MDGLALGDLLVVLPAWNEEESLPAVLAELRETVPEAGMVVVSDGSHDRTAEVSRAHGAEVLELPFNLGVGGAMRAGFVFALRSNYRAVVQLDADGQHDPREIGTLLRCQQETAADLVIGARFAGRGEYKVHGPRRWAMGFLRLVLSRVAGTRLTDTTSGFKLIGPRALELFARDYPAEYLGDTVEALVLAARHGLRIRQVGVEMRSRAGGVPSHNPLRAAIFLGRALIATAVALSRPRVAEGRPRRDVQ